MIKPQIITNGNEEVYASLICPGCETLGTIDKEQYEGKISIDCPECDFHKTIDFIIDKENEE